MVTLTILTDEVRVVQLKMVGPVQMLQQILIQHALEYEVTTTGSQTKYEMMETILITKDA